MDQSLLDLYTDYLLSSFGSTTATGLSTLLDDTISHDKITRFLSSERRSSADFWKLVKPLVRTIENSDGVLIIDDIIEEKPYTDENDLIAWHYDHSKDRNVKGINFMTALYHAKTVSIPVAFELIAKTEKVVDPKTGKQRRRSKKTKNELP
jgi:hypoxanthine-guanine phosphoribosyltransferase